MLEDSCFYSSLLAKAVTIAILNHFTVDAALWTEKLNLLNKQCFYLNSTQCQKL